MLQRIYLHKTLRRSWEGGNSQWDMERSVVNRSCLSQTNLRTSNMFVNNQKILFFTFIWMYTKTWSLKNIISYFDFLKKLKCLFLLTSHIVPNCVSTPKCWLCIRKRFSKCYFLIANNYLWCSNSLHLPAVCALINIRNSQIFKCCKNLCTQKKNARVLRWVIQAIDENWNKGCKVLFHFSAVLKLFKDETLLGYSKMVLV